MLRNGGSSAVTPSDLLGRCYCSERRGESLEEARSHDRALLDGAGGLRLSRLDHGRQRHEPVVASSPTNGRRLPGSAGLAGSRWRGPAARARSTRTTPSRGSRSSLVPRISSGRRSSSSTSTRRSTCSTSARTRSRAGRRRATTRSRATTASRPARRTCRRAGPTPPTPTSDFDTQGRVYQTMLPYNSFFDATKLHPDGEIDLSYSDDLGRHWVKGNGGVAARAAEQRLGQAGRARRGQAVGRRQPHRRQPVPGPRLRGVGGIQRQRRRDQGAHGGLARPRPNLQQGGHDHPAVCRSARAPPTSIRRSTPPATSTSRSSPSRRTERVDDLRRPLDRRRPHVQRVRADHDRDHPAGGSSRTPASASGITENFAASPTYPGHLYLTYEDWDAVAWHMDVKFTQSTDGGATWSTPARGQRQRRRSAARRPTSSSHRSRPAPTARSPSRSTTGAGPARTTRASCPPTSGRTNFCIDTSLQAYKDMRQRGGAGRRERADLAVHLGSGAAGAAPRRPLAVPVRGSARIPARAVAASSATTSGSRSPRYNVYALFVSTHYPSDVTADEGGPVYYQQQVLATVPRSSIGGGY